MENIRVLIVDDSSVMRKIVERSLRQANLGIAQIFDAGNGVEALGVLHREKVDLILCDINMPVMDGLEFVKQLPGSLVRSGLAPSAGDAVRSDAGTLMVTSAISLGPFERTEVCPKTSEIRRTIAHPNIKTDFITIHRRSLVCFGTSIERGDKYTPFASAKRQVRLERNEAMSQITREIGCSETETVSIGEPVRIIEF